MQDPNRTQEYRTGLFCKTMVLVWHRYCMEDHRSLVQEAEPVTQEKVDVAKMHLKMDRLN